MRAANTGDCRRPFKYNRPLQAVTAAYGIFWVMMAIAPYSRFNWLLENLLVFVTVIVLGITYLTFPFSNISYMLIAVFLALHTLGANYSYNTTPIDEWLHGLFHTERNSYDRIVHFSYGLLLAYPVKELIDKTAGVKRMWAFGLPVVIVLASGAFYELIEMWVAFIVAPEIGTLFLGTQGDPWDTQHDMELALYGSLIAMAVTTVGCRRRKRG